MRKRLYSVKWDTATVSNISTDGIEDYRYFYKPIEIIEEDELFRNLRNESIYWNVETLSKIKSREVQQTRLNEERMLKVLKTAKTKVFINSIEYTVRNIIVPMSLFRANLSRNPGIRNVSHERMGNE